MHGVTFPYFFVGTFIEAVNYSMYEMHTLKFPYFFVGTFIEAFVSKGFFRSGRVDFPTFS